MRHPFRRLRLPVLALVLAGTVDAAGPWRVPPLDGEVSGRLAVSREPGTPEVRWTLTTRTAGARRLGRLAGDAVGLRIRASAELDAAGSGSWKLIECRVDAATWLPVAAARAGATWSGATATGELNLTGAGVLRDGSPSGTVTLAVGDVTLRHPADGWSVAGIHLAGEFAFDPEATEPAGVAPAENGRARPPVRSAGPFELSTGDILTRRFGARNLRVRASLRPDGTIQVDAARLEIAGGEITAEPFTLTPSPLALQVKLWIEHVGLQDVVALVPSALAAASGRVDGTVELRWSQAGGFGLGNGHLAVRKGEPAEVRLAPSPGLISSSLPPAVLKYYPGLGEIETGVVPLRAEVLQISFHPNGDAEGRTATVHLTGGPVDPRFRAPIDLTVNVRGPLESLIRLGTHSGLSFGGGK